MKPPTACHWRKSSASSRHYAKRATGGHQSDAPTLPKLVVRDVHWAFPCGLTDYYREVIRSILEAYYEPQFSDLSHGFRPVRGPDTALQTIKRQWTGAKWWIEGDIKGYFDNIDHDTLMDILARNVKDQRFLTLIRRFLTTQYMEDWKLIPNLTGTPQGGILSPLLSNIYLNELDQHVTTVLIPEYTRGTQRRANRE